MCVLVDSMSYKNTFSAESSILEVLILVPVSINTRVKSCYVVNAMRALSMILLNANQFMATPILACLWCVSVSHRLQQHCDSSLEGRCRPAGEDMVEICASQKWQRLPKGAYGCFDGIWQLGISSASLKSSVTYNTTLTADNANKDVYQRSTGNAVCSGIDVIERKDMYGTATYSKNGKMASVCLASTGSVFRCDSTPPPNGYYVALWAPYNGQADASQPQPLNCNQTMTLKNPRLGRVATAKVIDRCASCVGVGFQTADPTTPECLVNGATIDMSLALWNYLFNNAAPTVYDIEYSGEAHAGWDKQPEPLTKLNEEECGC